MPFIEINNLGPVANFSMEIERFNLLIGEQATGKSTIAKAIYFFRFIKDTTADFLFQVAETNSYHGKALSDFEKMIRPNIKSVFISLFGFSWKLSPGLKLKYIYGKDKFCTIELKDKGKQYITVSFSHKLRSEILEIKALSEKMYKENAALDLSISIASDNRKKNREELRKLVNRAFEDERETYYIPAGRSMITLLANNRASVNLETLDFITQRFMRIIDVIRDSFEGGIRMVHRRYPNGTRRFDVQRVAEELINNIKGDYRYSGSREYLLVQESESGDKGKQVDVNYMSSGQQEILWLLNLIYILMLRNERSFVVIEEPEVHLYPNLVHKIIDFICFFANITDSAVLITTHSPYVMTSVNLFYCAGKVVEEFPEKAKGVYEILGRSSEIKPSEFKGVKLESESHYHSLIDLEMEELDTMRIDEISDLINQKYVNLLGLE